MSTHPTKDLETFVNPNQERDYTIIIDIPEFTCLCPKTGQAHSMKQSPMKLLMI